MAVWGRLSTTISANKKATLAVAFLLGGAAGIEPAFVLARINGARWSVPEPLAAYAEIEIAVQGAFPPDNASGLAWEP